MQLEPLTRRRANHLHGLDWLDTHGQYIFPSNYSLPQGLHSLPCGQPDLEVPTGEGPGSDFKGS